jgi:hypothetical protein
MLRLVLFVVGLGLAHLFGITNKEESRPGFFLLAQWIVLSSLLVVMLVLAASGDPLGVLGTPFVLLWFFPWPIARRVAIARGYWRTAWFMTRASAWTWYDDNRGGAVVAAAWASLRAPDRDAAIAFVERQCEHDDVGPASLLATGLLAQARGDLDGARRWITSLCEFEGKAPPRYARVLALQWCAAEAAGRGAWSSIATWADDREADRATKWLGLVARRLEGRAPVPSDHELRRGARRLPPGLRPLLDRALASPCEPRAPETVAPPPIAAMPVGSTHEIALQLHARVLAAEPRATRLTSIERVASAWDRLLRDDTFAARVRARATALGSGVDALVRLRERIDRDLLDVVWSGDVAIGEDELRRDDTLGRLRGKLHQRLLDELEVHADALSMRVKARRALPVHEEWREWLALRGAHDRAVALTGMRLRRLAFEIIHGPACALAAWLWNDRKQRVHAHQLFRWLLREAEVVDDAEAIALQRRNVDCGT